MGCCKYCGGPVEWKNAAGHFRDFCEVCANNVANGEDLRAKYDPDDDPVVATDGGLCVDGVDHVLECVHERTSADPDGNQNNTSNIWTGRTRMKADGSSNRSPLERDEVGDVVEQLIAQRKVIEWHGLLAPATEEHLKAIIQNEQESGAPRKLLVAKANRWLQSLRESDGKEIRADGSGDRRETILETPDGIAIGERAAEAANGGDSA